MVGCFIRPAFRRIFRRPKKTIVSEYPLCPVCLNPCFSGDITTLDGKNEPSPSTTPSPQAPTVSPSIYQPVDRDPILKVPCNETYHAACLRNMFECALQTKPYTPPRCCGNLIPMSLLSILYPNDLTRKLEEFRNIVPNSVSCAHCKRWVMPEDITEEEESGICEKSHGGCGGHTCVLCGKQAHGEDVCENMTEVERADAQFKRKAGISGWKPCSQCGYYLSRDRGCREVVCICGNHELLDF